jgi:transposase
MPPFVTHSRGPRDSPVVTYCQALLRLRPPLRTLSTLGQEFVQLIGDRKSEALLPWLEQAQACPYEEVRRFALGLLKEFAAVQAALSEPWSQGQVEGQITKLKLLKRQRYGRAHIDLLRLRLNRLIKEQGRNVL